MADKGWYICPEAKECSNIYCIHKVMHTKEKGRHFACNNLFCTGIDAQTRGRGSVCKLATMQEANTILNETE